MASAQRIPELRVAPQLYPPGLVRSTPATIRKWLSDHPEIVTTEADEPRGGITVERLIFESPPTSPVVPVSAERPQPEGFAEYDSVRRR